VNFLFYVADSCALRPRRFARLGPLLGLVLLLAGPPAGAAWLEREAAIMGTAVRLELWYEPSQADDALAAAEAVFGELRRIDALMSPYKDDSELSQLNREAATGPQPIGPELSALIARSLEVSELTRGAFDITYASVGHLYDYRNRERPTGEAVTERLPAIDYRHLRLDRAAGTLAYADAKVRIDLGGIAKGYAVERAVALLRERGFRHALVSAGGDTRLLGDRHGRPWIIGVRDPRSEGEVVVRLPLEDEATSTSGDYERYFLEDGERYHHILDPRTGGSAREVQSVTVIGPDATLTDALSTSVFVLGVERGVALIDGLPDYEAILVDAAGRMHYSTGLEPL
jgi:thiamine biosynthesis lipoprotein